MTYDSDPWWEKNPFSNGHDAEPGPQDYDGTMPPWVHPQEAWEPIDLASAMYPAYEREWLIPGWLPLGETIGLSGPGGEGKTLIAQMLANAARCGGNWLGLPCAQMRSALVLCEDTAEDTLWRQRDIAPLYNNPTLSDLAPWMLLLPRRHNAHNYLAVFDRDDQCHETVFFSQLLKRLKTFAEGWPLLTVIDCKSDVFWGKQNIEQHARVFVKTICDRIVRETQGLCILIYHPSMTAIREGSGSSGSVQWDAAFGARLYFASEDKDNPDTRTLSLLKANHAQKGKSIEVQWEKGVFRTSEEIDAAKPDYERQAEKSKFQRIFIEMFDKHSAISKEPLPKSTAPRELADLYNADPPNKDKISPREMKSAMSALLLKKIFTVETVQRQGRRDIEALKKAPSV
jgi:hypothetical protein